MLVWLAACGPTVALDDGGDGQDSSAGDGSTSSMSVGTSPSPMTSTSTTTSTTTVGTSPTTTLPPMTTVDPSLPTDGVSFLDGGDMVVVEDCDVWQQDCARGEKCMPWANDGSGVWNALACRPVAPDPAQPGDTCFVEGFGASGYDTCDFGAMCWDVDPATLTGVCVEQCTGTPMAPICSDPDTTCVAVVPGIVEVCLQVCDPLLQDCPEGNGCYPSDDAFVCLPMEPVVGGVGEPCEAHPDCIAGTLCVDPALVPGCMPGAVGCCTSWCDVTEPMPHAVCEPGQQCEPYWEEGVSPGIEQEGICAVP